MKKEIAKNLREEIEKRYSSFLSSQNLSVDVSNRKFIYLKNHASRLATSLNKIFGVESVDDFAKIDKEKLLTLISEKIKTDKKEKEVLDARTADRAIMYIDFLNGVFSEIPNIEYKETELYSIQQIKCPYCGTLAEFRSSSDGRYDFYICPKCQAKGSVHPHTAILTSSLANTELREHRRKVYSVINATFNDRKAVYPFICKVLKRTLDHSVSYLGSLTEDESEAIIHICNYMHEMSGYLKSIKNDCPNTYLLAYNFLKVATVDELRAAYLYKKNFEIPKIASVLHIDMNRCMFMLYIMFGNGFPLKLKTLPIIKRFVVDHKDTFAKYYDSDFATFYGKICRANALTVLSDSNSLGSAIGYYQRVILLKKLKEIPVDEFERTKIIK